MLKLAALLLAAVTLPLPQSGREHVGLAATLEHGAGGERDVVVRFMPLLPSVHVNAEPAPRLALDPEQRLLRESPRTAPPATRLAFPHGRYLDTRVGVRFPARVVPGAKAGRHTLRGTLTYFYCSVTEGWCRRAQDEVEIEASLP